MSEVFYRPPIVTVMGHVDHGKTSILDGIRKTNVTAKEFGGITQHIGAYQIEFNSKKITFIDTPGHAAFSQMRSRGGKVADIVILVVAADAGVQAQTKEAIAHAKASGGTIIVAINKIDLPAADAQKAKQQLAQEDILVEDWGGSIVAVEVSAKTGKGLDKLLEMIQLVAEMQEIKARPEGALEAIIIEAKMDKKKGALVNVIVKDGTLKVGEEVYASGKIAKIRSLMNDKGQMVKEALPGDPVEILGFKEIPSVGDTIVQRGSGLEEFSESTDKIEIVGKETKKTVNIILKADTFGTLEAVKASLSNLVTSNVNADYSIKFLLTSTGEINDSDVLLAQSTNGLIVGFNLKLSSNIEDLAESKNVFIKVYKTIYELIDDVKDILEGKAVFDEQKIKGRAIIQKLFKLPSGDMVLGCKILAGSIKSTSRVSIFSKNPADLSKDDQPLYTGNVKTLKRGRDDISVAVKDTECGVLLKPEYLEAKEGFFIEVR
ncbi:MAG: translation initiation factor IF-2 [Proteobacteria bacterium]|nr:translation initiation factor IF-2 [Pseudomonadota bacterium]